jgi:hypothetical protein
MSMLVLHVIICHVVYPGQAMLCWIPGPAEQSPLTRQFELKSRYNTFCHNIPEDPEVGLGVTESNSPPARCTCSGTSSPLADNWVGSQTALISCDF